jgi:hypothetical protein
LLRTIAVESNGPAGPPAYRDGESLC